MSEPCYAMCVFVVSEGCCAICVYVVVSEGCCFESWCLGVVVSDGCYVMSVSVSLYLRVAVLCLCRCQIQKKDEKNLTVSGGRRVTYTSQTPSINPEGPQQQPTRNRRSNGSEI